MIEFLRGLFGSREVEQMDKRIDALESRVHELEREAVRESDVEVLRNKVESVSDGSGSVSKEVRVKNRIVELVGRGLEKADVRKKVVEVDELCSDSYFYENWNGLEDMSYLVERDGSTEAVVDEVNVD